MVITHTFILVHIAKSVALVTKATEAFVLEFDLRLSWTLLKRIEHIKLDPNMKKSTHTSLI